ncbi:hypothetical protein [Labrenzia sp. CE80]|nr:hypothetical protein [Labrenzia sp. CE80]
MTDAPRLGGRYIRDPKTGERVREDQAAKTNKPPKAKPKAEKD